MAANDDILELRKEHCFDVPRARGYIPKYIRHADQRFNNLPHPSEIQGDVFYGFPRFYERFVFFRINDVAEFKKALHKFEPTSGEDVHHTFFLIDKAKEKKSGERVPTKQLQIAFSRTGMHLLRVGGDTGDERFDKRRMRDDKHFLGDQRTWQPPFSFKEKPSDPTSGTAKDVNDPWAVHGVIVIATDQPEPIEEATKQLKEDFGKSWAIPDGWILDGKSRGRDQDKRHHEHFGFLDGISQPAMRGLTSPLPGQLHVDPGVIIMGYKGDPHKDTRPDWAKGGSVMAFRKLKQDVPEFDAYCKRNGKYWSEITKFPKKKLPEGVNISSDLEPELLAARLIGRWKSGAPLALCPFRDNKTLGSDPTKNNNFNYTKSDDTAFPELLSEEICPFTAHARKTVPRNLDPLIKEEFLKASAIAREATPYGAEVTDIERENEQTILDRGLLFNCYSSDLDSGFVRQTTGFGNNDYFPVTGLKPTKHGQDPIIGGPPPAGSSGQTKDASISHLEKPFKDGDQVNLRLHAKEDDTFKTYVVDGHVRVEPATKDKPEPFPFFVTSNGGEYFFVPSIKTLDEWSGKPPREPKDKHHDVADE